MNSCALCNGVLEETKTNYMADLNGKFIIIKNVPCYKCSQCGEVSYSGEVVTRIESILETLKDALNEVTVVEYAA